MEEADNLLIMSLRDVGCPLEEGVKSVKQLIESDSTLVYQACVCFLKAIDPARELPESLPRHMSSRVAACTTIAATVKEMGYRAELNYHHLLYPSESDTRHLFMFLAKSVPEAEKPQEASKPELLVTEQIRKALAAFVKTAAPAASSSAAACALGTTPLRTPHRGRALRVTPGLEAYYRDHLRPVSAQPPRIDMLAPSVFESTATALAEARQRELENQAGLDSGLNPIQYAERRRAQIAGSMATAFRASLAAAAQQQRAMLQNAVREASSASGAQAGRFGRQVAFATEEAASSAAPQETQEERLAKQQAELDERQAVLAKAQAELAQLSASLQAFDSSQRRAEAEAAQADAAREALEREYKVKKRTFDLLPEADANARELERLADASAARLSELAAEWEKHRAPLVAELRELQDARDAAMGASRTKLEDIRRLRAEMKALVEEIRGKEEKYRQLVDTYSGMQRDLSRAVYTRRILDVVRNVKKQKRDIEKVLGDTRQLQKEINGVRDTLGRSFAVADDLLFQEAKKEQAKGAKADASKKDAYKHLVAINKSFEALVQAIEEIGSTKNNILNLESKIDQIHSRISTINVERVTEDLKQIRAENTALASKIAKLDK
eukprot:m51a1_g4770 hypothetical protein (614) ;mRNA; f:19052-21602